MGAATGATCEICAALGDAQSIGTHMSTAGGAFPPEADRLEVVPPWGSLLRCPLCGAHYRLDEVFDHDHFYLVGTATLRRLSPGEALDLFLASGAEADLARLVPSRDAQIAALAGEAAARALAFDRARRGTWAEVEALLEHADAAVRAGAASALFDMAASAKPPWPAARAIALVARLAGEEADRAHDALARLAPAALAPALGALIDRLDDADARVRYRAVRLLLGHLEGRAREASNVPPIVPAPFPAEVVARIPALVRHVGKPRRALRPPQPRDARWPPATNTAEAAAALLEALGGAGSA